MQILSDHYDAFLIYLQILQNHYQYLNQKQDEASLLKKLSRQLSIYDADEDLSMASADQRTTTGGLSGTQNSSQGPQISESASVPLMRKSLRNEYQIQTVQKQDENKTGNTKAFPKAQWTQALSALAQSTMFKLQFHYHTISPLIAKSKSKSRSLSKF